MESANFTDKDDPAMINIWAPSSKKIGILYCQQFSKKILKKMIFLNEKGWKPELSMENKANQERGRGK